MPQKHHTEQAQKNERHPLKVYWDPDLEDGQTRAASRPEHNFRLKLKPLIVFGFLAVFLLSRGTSDPPSQQDAGGTDSHRSLFLRLWVLLGAKAGG